MENSIQSRTNLPKFWVTYRFACRSSPLPAGQLNSCGNCATAQLPERRVLGGDGLAAVPVLHGAAPLHGGNVRAPVAAVEVVEVPHLNKVSRIIQDEAKLLRWE